MRLECHYYRRLLLLLCSWRVGRASAFIIGGPPSPSYSSLTSLAPTKRGGIRKGGGGVLPLPLRILLAMIRHLVAIGDDERRRPARRPVEITGASVSSLGFLAVLRSSERYFTATTAARMLLLRRRSHSRSFSHLRRRRRRRHHSPPTTTT